jgi:acetolactate synthase-1/2/3 large subunit
LRRKKNLPKDSPNKMTGARGTGVPEERRGDVLFGLPGGVLLPLYDAIYHSDIRHILGGHPY